MDLEKSFDLELCFDSVDANHTSSSSPPSTVAKDCAFKISPMKRSTAKPSILPKLKRNKPTQKLSYAICPSVSPIAFVDSSANNYVEQIMKEPLHRFTPTNEETFQPINEDDKEFLATMMDQLG